MDAFFHDWRSVAGVVLPHYVEISFGTGMFSVRWDEVELLSDIPPDLFRLPQ